MNLLLWDQRRESSMPECLVWGKNGEESHGNKTVASGWPCQRTSAEKETAIRSIRVVSGQLKQFLRVFSDTVCHAVWIFAFFSFTAVLMTLWKSDTSVLVPGWDIAIMVGIRNPSEKWWKITLEMVYWHSLQNQMWSQTHMNSLWDLRNTCKFIKDSRQKAIKKSKIWLTVVTVSKP